MKRCQPTRVLHALACSLLLSCAALVAVPAAAQGIVREAPKDVKLARMAVGYPPEITIDGQPDRLSPGVRIRDVNNMLLLTGALAGRTVPVVYRRDAAGLVHEVWLLTPQEYEKLSGLSTSGPNALQLFVDTLALVFGARR